MDILRFLQSHPCLNRLELERQAGLPHRTLKLNERNFRLITPRHNEKLERILQYYGYHIFTLGTLTRLPGDVVHFGIGTEAVYEARIVWDKNSYRYIFEPTGRTPWLPWLDIINPNWFYYE
jgi:hypothetical protein